MKKVVFITIVIVLLGGAFFAYQKFFPAKEPGFYLNSKERMDICDILPTITRTTYGVELTIPDGYPVLSSAKSGTSTVQWYHCNDPDYRSRWDALTEPESIPKYTDSLGNVTLARHHSKHDMMSVLDSINPDFLMGYYKNFNNMIACEKVSGNRYIVRLRDQDTGEFCDLNLVRIRGETDVTGTKDGEYASDYLLPHLEPGVYLLNINLSDFLPIVVE